MVKPIEMAAIKSSVEKSTDQTRFPEQIALGGREEDRTTCRLKEANINKQSLGNTKAIKTINKDKEVIPIKVKKGRGSCSWNRYMENL